jgi:hypothetical protein
MTMSTGDFWSFNNSASKNYIDTTWAAGSLDLSQCKEIIEIQNQLAKIEQQLCILKPDEHLQEKYPALKEAYDAYQLILKLVNDQTI